MEAELKKQIRKHAELTERSMNYWVNKWIEEGLERCKKDEK